jgi:hypothetical protein
MKYLKTVFTLCAISVLASCASSTQPNQYGLVGYVQRYGGGQYYVDGIQGFDSPHIQALNQCRVDGNKQLQVISNSFTQGFSGTNYPALVFKCI